MQEMFTVSYSSDGTNAKQKEINVIKNFWDYLEDCEGIHTQKFFNIIIPLDMHSLKLACMEAELTVILWHGMHDSIHALQHVGII
jgi:hypothetical protein